MYKLIDFDGIYEHEKEQQQQNTKKMFNKNEQRK